MAKPAAGRSRPGRGAAELRSAGDVAEPKRGGAARRPTGTHRARPCSGRGVVRGGIPPDYPPGAKASGCPSPRGDPALAQNAGFCRGLPPCSFGGGAPKLYKSPFCVGAGGRGRRGGWGPDGPGWRAAPIPTEGAGRLGEPGSPSGPRRKTESRFRSSARNPQDKNGPGRGGDPGLISSLFYPIGILVLILCQQ